MVVVVGQSLVCDGGGRIVKILAVSFCINLKLRSRLGHRGARNMR